MPTEFDACKTTTATNVISIVDPETINLDTIRVPRMVTLFAAKDGLETTARKVGL